MAALDGVRGLAIVAVLFVHFVGNLTATTHAERLLEKMSNYGVWGVDLFFVLSGFLITGILWDTKTSGRYFRNFYVRRTLRIFPLYYAVLALLFVVLPLVLGSSALESLRGAREHQAWLWTYTANFYIASKGTWALPYVSHFWSLAIEEHFYLVWPLVVLVCTGPGLLRVCAGAIGFSLALRCVLASRGFNDVTLQTLTPCRLDTLCVGAYMAVAARIGGLEALARRARPLLYVSAALVFATSLWHATLQTFDAFVLPLRGTLVALFFGAMIVVSIAPSEPNALFRRFFSSRVMRMIGKYSYGLYVYHGIIAFGLAEKQPMAQWATGLVGSHVAGMLLQAFVGAVVSLLVSVVSYEFFESRFLLLKDRLAPNVRTSG